MKYFLEGHVNLKILVLSDTHNNIANASRLLKELDPDYTFHLGDMADDCVSLERLFPRKIIASVRGNNDFFDTSYPLERVAVIGGKTIFACHGHKYHVKSSLLSLEYKAQELGADIVLFGHTHTSYIDISPKRIIMNPGSVSSYGIIEITDGNINARIEKI